jgi:hypothetical protein
MKLFCAQTCPTRCLDGAGRAGGLGETLRGCGRHRDLRRRQSPAPEALMRRILVSVLLVAPTLGCGAAPESDPAAAAASALTTESAALRPANVPAEFRWTHHGYFHPNCMVKVELGEIVNGDGDIVQTDGTIRKIPSCEHPHYDRVGKAIAGTLSRESSRESSRPVENAIAHNFTGWLADFDEYVPGKITWYSNVMIVPPAPWAHDGQDVALFGGLQSGSEILQPVLDYGDGSDGGSSNHWQIRAENCCLRGNDFFTAYRSVNQGDSINGYMYPEPNTACPGSAGQWYIGINGNGANATGFSTCAWSGANNDVVGGALELHGLTRCGDLPNTSGAWFQNISTYVNGANHSFNWNLFQAAGITPNCRPTVTASGTSGHIDFLWY